MEDNYNYVAVSLSISSERLLPEQMTLIIGAEPTYTRRCGELTRTGVARRPEFDLNEWQLREQVSLQAGEDVAQRSQELTNAFFSRIEPLVAGLERLDESADILILFVYSLDFVPYIGLTKDQVRIVAALGARLDYDLMLG